MGGGLDPGVVWGEAGVGADGANYAIAGDGGFVDVLQEAVKDAAEISLTLRVKAGGVSVTKQRTDRDAIMKRGVIGAVPVKEKLLDDFAVRVRADDALALVPLEGRLGRGDGLGGAGWHVARDDAGFWRACDGGTLFGPPFGAWFVARFAT